MKNEINNELLRGMVFIEIGCCLNKRAEWKKKGKRLLETVCEELLPNNGSLNIDVIIF